MYGCAFAIDAVGDVYLTGRTPLHAVTEDELDRLLGAILTYADENFDTMLEIGFSSAIRREWAWRVSRGESTRNLQAFAHLLEPSGGQPHGEQPEGGEASGEEPDDQRPDDAETGGSVPTAGSTGRSGSAAS